MFNLTKAKFHVRQVRSITFLNIHLRVPSKSPHTTVVHVWNPMTHFHSSALGSSILDELVFQIMLGLPFQNAWKWENFKIVRNVAQGSPTLLIIAKGGRSSCWTTLKWRFGSKMSSIKHVGDLGMKWYALWSTSSEATLIHMHRKWWACELTTTSSTCISSLIQALICCHVTNTASWESPKGGTFSDTYAHECSWEVYKYCSTWINS